MRPASFHLRGTLVTAAVGALSLACGGAAKPDARRTPPAGTISPLPRSVRVEQDSVVVEGRWYPIEPGPESPVLQNAVRVVCGRAERLCKEDLTRAAEPGTEPVHEALDYRVENWTRWGTPAGKLVAARREGAAEVEIRVSLSGLTAEKVVVAQGRQTRWRIE